MPIQDLAFAPLKAQHYKSATQKIRVLSEEWVSRSLYCPNCGNEQITPRRNNSAVSDFSCTVCAEEYELKSQKGTIKGRVVDGAYETMMRRLKEANNPNLLLLSYDPAALSVLGLTVVPKHFFIPELIEKRKPLSATARRAGWTGCNILLDNIPHAGRISLVHNRIVSPKPDVLALWRRTLFLNDQASPSAKTWLLNVMRCVEDIGKPRFSLSDVYAFEDRLRRAYPANQHIKEKIRQQLQVLRDNGFLRFLSKGEYELTH